MKAPIKVAVLIYSGVELVDMNGPLDVFLHANSYNDNRYQVYTVAATSDPIISEGKVVTITPQYNIKNCPDPDVIVIPGIINLQVDPAMIAWLKKMTQKKTRVFLSVCIGLYTLAQTGILSGRRATTHYLAINAFHTQYPDVQIVKNVRFVEDNNIVSTAGITSGIDGALHLVEKYDGAIVAQQTADVMIYNRDNPLPPFTTLPPYFNI